jgi:transcriptional regulator with XRE-family HTH domain
MSEWETHVRAYLNAYLEPRGAQAALARQMTIHDQAWLSRYLAGAFSMDLGTLQEICAALSVDVADLLRGSTTEPMTEAQREAMEVAAQWPHVDPVMRKSLRSMMDFADVRSPADRRAGPASPGTSPVPPATAKETGTWIRRGKDRRRA